MGNLVPVFEFRLEECQVLPSALLRQLMPTGKDVLGLFIFLTILFFSINLDVFVIFELHASFVVPSMILIKSLNYHNI